MSEIRNLANKKQEYKEFKEFSSRDKEKIAAIVESKSNEFMISPVVDSFVYASNRAVDYGDYYGVDDSRAMWSHAVNRNADFFDTTVMHEIIPGRKIARWESFRNCGVFTDHNSKSAENSIGVILDAFDVRTNYEDQHITLLLGIDKTKAPRIARSLETHPTAVASSMGCTIQLGTCTVCGESGCTHLKYMRNGVVSGKKVAEFLHGIEFFEDSIVSTPACHTAYVVDALSGLVPGRTLKIASQSDDTMVTLQIMKSIYDSIKTASTIAEKNRLSENLDKLLAKLNALAETSEI